MGKRNHRRRRSITTKPSDDIVVAVGFEAPDDGDGFPRSSLYAPIPRRGHDQRWINFSFSRFIIDPAMIPPRAGTEIKSGRSVWRVRAVNGTALVKGDVVLCERRQGDDANAANVSDWVYGGEGRTTDGGILVKGDVVFCERPQSDEDSSAANISSDDLSAMAHMAHMAHKPEGEPINYINGHVGHNERYDHVVSEPQNFWHRFKSWLVERFKWRYEYPRSKYEEATDECVYCGQPGCKNPHVHGGAESVEDKGVGDAMLSSIDAFVKSLDVLHAQTSRLNAWLYAAIAVIVTQFVYIFHLVSK